MLKRDKERIVAELVERLRTSDTLIVADYRGLSMSQMDDVRTQLLEHGARFTVVKNTLTKLAAEAAGVNGLDELLDGPTAIAFVGDGDMVAVAKTLNDTARQTRVLALRGGIVNGEPITADQVRDLAALPPADVLRGQVLGTVVAPLNAIVGLVNAPLRDFVGVIEARVAQLQEQGEGVTEERGAAVETEPAAEAAPEQEETNEAEQEG